MDEETYRKTAEEFRKKLLIQKNKIISYTVNLALVVGTTLGAAYFIGHRGEQHYLQELPLHLESIQCIFRREDLVLSIKHFSRRMDFIANNKLLDPNYALFNQTKIDLKENSLRLSTIEKSYIEIKRRKKNAVNGRKSVLEATYPFLVVLRDGSCSMIQSDYQDGVYQYLSSTSKIMNSGVKDLRRTEAESDSLQEICRLNSDFESENSGKVKNKIMTAERMHFHRLDYNSIHSLRTGNDDIIDRYESLIKERFESF